MTAQPEPTEGPRAERRQAHRLVPEEAVTVTLRCGARHRRCRVEDVSFTGMRLRLEGTSALTGPVTVEHAAAGAISGRPVWRHGPDLGIAFQAPQSRLERALQCISLAFGAAPEDTLPRA